MEKTQTNLQHQLEAYSLASKSMRVPKNWSSAGTVLATVAGSALAMATNANASIIYSGVQNVTVSEPAQAKATSSAALTGIPFAIRVRNFSTVRTHNTASANLHQTPFSVNAKFIANSGNFNVIKLASGAAISAGQFFHFKTFPLLRRKNVFSFTGDFVNSSTGFAGIEFEIGGQEHFGWIRLHDSIGPNNAVTLKAIDWAYNDVAGAEIRAGQGTPTPEPSTASLAILAAGAAGVLAWRKRRKQVAG